MGAWDHGSMGAWARFVARFRRDQRVRVSGSPVKVNVGAGLEVADGWINVDGSIHALASRLPPLLLSQIYRRTGTVRRLMSEPEYIDRLKRHRFVFHDLTDGLPFETGMVDYIFCSHVLEHFSRAGAQALTRELHRVLKPGGRLRVVVPDLAKAFALYQQGARELALQYFFTDGRPGSHDQHRYMYDFELMEKLLTSQGFADVRRYGYREGMVPDLDKLDNRPDESLYVEAIKME
ncbi:MAG: class I SAM-dependent methyltransferase [Gemmatimonadota bacterium]